MTNTQMSLIVLFEDLTAERVNVDSLDEARYKAENQYIANNRGEIIKDRIIDWYVVDGKGMRLR